MKAHMLALVPETTHLWATLCHSQTERGAAVMGAVEVDMGPPSHQHAHNLSHAPARPRAGVRAPLLAAGRGGEVEGRAARVFAAARLHEVGVGASRQGGSDAHRVACMGVG